MSEGRVVTRWKECSEPRFGVPTPGGARDLRGRTPSQSLLSLLSRRAGFGLFQTADCSAHHPTSGGESLSGSGEALTHPGLHQHCPHDCGKQEEQSPEVDYTKKANGRSEDPSNDVHHHGPIFCFTDEETGGQSGSVTCLVN